MLLGYASRINKSQSLSPLVTDLVTTQLLVIVGFGDNSFGDNSLRNLLVTLPLGLEGQTATYTINV